MNSGPDKGQSHPLQGVPACRAVCLDALNSAGLLDHYQGPSFCPQSHHPEGNTLLELGLLCGQATKWLLLQVTAGHGHGAESRHLEPFPGGDTLCSILPRGPQKCPLQERRERADQDTPTTCLGPEPPHEVAGQGGRMGAPPG